MTPRIMPLGDCGLLVRFSDALDDEANALAVAFARDLSRATPPGVLEVVPNLVSVFLRFDRAQTGFSELAGELKLRLVGIAPTDDAKPEVFDISVRFGGEDGPDLEEVAAASGIDTHGFIDRHAKADLRVLAIGFAPGFAYCGFHRDLPVLPRRGEMRPCVPAGTVLYAAGQTALTATAIPTGWHVIGRTEFRNFDPGAAEPVRLLAGARVRFVPA